MKRRLARHIPEDKNIRQFLRWGRWKCVLPADGRAMLFDVHGPFGISEQDDVAARHPEVIAAITSYFEANDITARRVCVPDSFKFRSEVKR